MKRVLFLLLMFGGFVCAAPQPNVLLIVADDLGYADLSCYGNDCVQTPNIDQLAEQGFCLTQFYAAGLVCTLTRASIVSGKYPLRTDYFKRGDLYSRGGTCLLKNEKQLGENHLYYPMFFTDIMGEEIIRLLKKFQTPVSPRTGEGGWGKPFFIHANFQVPHLPLERAPKPHWTATAAVGLSEDQHRIRSMIARLDYQVGRILEVVGDNTLVVFTSDTGGHRASNNGEWRNVCRWCRPEILQQQCRDARAEGRAL